MLAQNCVCFATLRNYKSIIATIEATVTKLITWPKAKLAKAFLWV